MKSVWLRVCFLNFLMASLLGLMLRFSHLLPFAFERRYVVHAHSHVALLGWAYLAVFTLAVMFFVPADKQPRYNGLFWLTEICVLGMLATFPFMGYALWSIVFSTGHIFCSYVFAYRVWKDIPASPAGKLLRAALVWMLLSTLGVWALGPIGGPEKHPELFQTAIQTFLHFQFHGWFLIAALALVFRFRDIDTGNADRYNRFFNMLMGGTLLTVGLPISWYFPSVFWQISFSIGAVFLLIAAYDVWKMTRKSERSTLFAVASGSFVLKTIMQLLAIIPFMAEQSGKIRELTIGFIHLMMLGVVTGFLLFLMENCGFALKPVWRTGVLLILSAFGITEILILAQGISYLAGIGYLTGSTTLLAAVSVLFPIGIAVCWRAIR